MSEPTEGGAVATTQTPVQGAKKKIGPKQIIAFLFGIVIVVAIFVYAIPKFADYGDVWDAMKTLTPIEWASLVAATVFNLYTYWLANQAALPGLRMSQSVVVTQTGTSVANTLPAGGAIAIGVTYAILESWGFTAGEGRALLHAAAGLLLGVDALVAEGNGLAHARSSSPAPCAAPAGFASTDSTMPARISAMPAKWYGRRLSPSSAAERNAPNSGISVIACPARAGPTVRVAELKMKYDRIEGSTQT